ncbi:MAG: T9SS type A sorting domain-containing protein [Ignavibacteriae bacterium]|nr:T9SS type A sorting domain-containing protein [Ignavibacteriota bacterium]
MKKLKLFFVTTIFFCFNLVLLYSQNTIPSTGKDVTCSSGSVSYSIGQSFYNIDYGNNGSIIQGVQQPFEISVVGGIDESDCIKLNCSTYPNPVSEFLNISIEGFTYNKYYATLYNSVGKKIKEIQIVSDETLIDMKNLASGNYYLNVMNQNSAFKVFKIIKN